MQITQKIRIFPTPEQQEILNVLSEKCRLIYNFALKERIDKWENERKTASYIEQQNKLPEIKKQYPEYKWVYSKVLQMVLRTLDADFKSFYALRKKDENASPPRFKGKKYFTTMVYNQSGFKVHGYKITLSQNYNNEIPLEFTTEFSFDECKIKQVTVFKKDDKYFLSIAYEIEEKEYIDNLKYQAIDLGVSNIVTAVNTNGKFIQIPNNRADKYWQPKIEQLQSRADHCKKDSIKWKMLNDRLHKMKRKCANQLKDFQHKLSKEIVENTKANTIIVGDLDVKDMSSKKQGQKKRDRSLHRAMQNTGCLSRFVQFLTYKAKIIGKKVIEINERYTSKTCYACGKKHDMKLYKRNMKCDCGNNMDRDKNSAINIMIRFLSQNAYVDGLDIFMSNLRKTGEKSSQEAPCVSVG